MLIDETDIQVLSRRCNEFEHRIAKLEDSSMIAHNNRVMQLPTLDECYKAIPFPEDEREAAMFCAGIAECHKFIIYRYYL